MLTDALRDVTKKVREKIEQDRREAADGGASTLLAQLRRGQLHDLLSELKKRL